MTIAEAYRFFVDVPGIGITEVFPKNDALEWENRQNDQFRFYHLTLKTKLIFEDRPSEGINDFSKLYNIILSGLTCQRVNVRFDKYCDCTSSWTTSWFKGFLRLSKGKWNISRCFVEIEVATFQPQDCLVEQWEDELNLFDYGGGTITVTPFAGVLQEQCCERQFAQGPGIPVIDAHTFYADACLPDPETWAVTAHGLSITQYAPNGIYGGRIRTCWAREYVTGGSQPPGIGWIQVNGTDWARPVSTSLNIFYPNPEDQGLDEIAEFFPDPLLVLQGSFLYIYDIIGVQEDGSTGFPNGKVFNDVLEGIVEGLSCGMTIVSDFFGINPDGTAPNNAYYQRAVIDAKELSLHAVSDIALLDESEAATVMTSQLKELLEFGQLAFNCDVGLEGNTIRIEHASYFSESVQEDLTQPSKRHLIEGKWEFAFVQENLPAKEHFRWAATTDEEGGDFDGVPIRYENICVRGNRDAGERSFSTRTFLTNIEAIVGDEDFFRSDKILVISNQGGIMNKAVCPLSGKVRLNGNLSFSYLHPRYHDYGRPFRSGFINNLETVMQAITRSRKQTEIEIPLDCKGYDGYNPSKLIKTQMGGGAVESDSYKEPAQILTVNLLFP